MNNHKDIISFILISNSGLVCKIFRVSDDKKIVLIGESYSSSEGIQNGIVVNIELASKSVRICISEAEKKAKINLSDIHILFEPTNLLSTRVTKYKKLGGSKIYKEDISYLISEGKNQILSNDVKRNILHTYNFNYVVDNVKFLSEPINIYSDFFSHELSFLTLPKNIFKNITQVFNNCELRIDRFILNSFALGVENLTNEEINNGCLIINFENKNANLIFFLMGSIIFYKTLPISIGHIIMDISKGCSLSLSEAQKIFQYYGIIERIDLKKEKSKKKTYINQSFFTESKYRKISENLIFEIISSRSEEIVEFINKNINSSGLNLENLQKAYFYGNTYGVEGIEKFLSNNFEAFFENIDSSMDIAFKGGLKIILEGHNTEAIPGNNQEKVKKFWFF